MAGMRTARYEYEAEKKRKRLKAIFRRIMVGLILLALAAGLFFGIRAAYRKIHGWVDSVMNDPLLESTASAGNSTLTPATTVSRDPEIRYAAELEHAEKLALYYDYEGAITLLQDIPSYADEPYLKSVVQDYIYARNNLVKLDISQVYHLYTGSLIASPERAFSSRMGNQETNNRERITVNEFQGILQQLYDNGFVLLSFHQLAYSQEDGSFSLGSIYLPKGKKGLVLTLDDPNYPEDATANGLARKMILDAREQPLCELAESDGSLRVGAFDMVPIVENFIASHPDFSYQGARGVLALTGYEGIFGYRTASFYSDPTDPAYKAEYASINGEQEKLEAEALCRRLKELGWELACQTWGRINVEKADLGRIQADTERWLKEVAPLTGGSDIMIFPPGSDIGNWRPYGEDNEKFVYYRSQGFRYFSSMDNYTIPWVQFNGEGGCLRMGRVGLSGYALAYRKDKLGVFFNSDGLMDPARPLPVPEN